MTVRTCLIIACLVVSLGCRKTSTPPPTAPPPGTATPSPELSHVAGGETRAPQTKYFKGSIGTSLDLQMKLVRTGDQLAGSYFYQKIGTRINLRGNVDKDGNLTLEEFDPAGKQTGLFKGIWTVDAGDGLINLAGNWSKPPGEKGSEKKIAFSVHEEPIAFTGDVEIVSKQIKESNKKLRYEIAAQYPQISGGANPNFEKFNQAARALVNKEVSDFKKGMQPEEDEAEPPTDESGGSDLSVSYIVALAQDDLVSVKFDVSNYEAGAAHPNPYSHVLNYDLKNGKQLKLSDLFKPGAKFLQPIATYCIADLKKQQKDLPVDQIEEGAAAKSENYGSWTITRRGLGIHFDAYQVGPYAAGPQFVLVPYSNLKDLINPDGPIGGTDKR
jgi:hypothetical protein